MYQKKKRSYRQQHKHVRKTLELSFSFLTTNFSVVVRKRTDLLLYIQIVNPSPPLSSFFLLHSASFSPLRPPHNIMFISVQYSQFQLYQCINFYFVFPTFTSPILLRRMQNFAHFSFACSISGDIATKCKLFHFFFFWVWRICQSCDFSALEYSPPKKRSKVKINEVKY